MNSLIFGNQRSTKESTPKKIMTLNERGQKKKMIQSVGENHRLLIKANQNLLRSLNLKLIQPSPSGEGDVGQNRRIKIYQREV